MIHGITHHSPTALNLAAANLPLYLVERVLGKKSPASCAMHRGSSAEQGIVEGLLDPAMPVATCQDIALAAYDKLTALSGDPKRASERDGIPGLVEQGLLALRPYGVPDEVQVKVYHEVPGVRLPFVGYCDLGWTQHGIRLDIKTSLQLPSVSSEAYRRQAAFYVYKTNSEARLAHLSPKKHGVYRVEDPAADMAALVEIARRLEKFLSLSSDPMELAELLIPDYSSFYWNGAAIREIGRQIFRF